MSDEPLQYAEHGVIAWPEYTRVLDQRDEARNLIAEVLRDLPDAGKDNDDVFTVWQRLYRAAYWLHPEETK
jgi:hypothetical protein